MWGQIFSTEWTNLVAMIPLLIGSIVTIGIIVERFLNFRPAAMFDQKTVDAVVEKVAQADGDAAMTVVGKKETLLENLLHEGLQDHYKKQVLPEVAFLDHGMSKLGVLATWVPVLNFVAKVAPLVGLLGTVLGMIDSFEVISASSDENAEVKPEEVAKGIGTALLTTASGLMVAIPAMAASTVLTRMGMGVYQQFEDAFRQVTIAAGGLRGNVIAPTLTATATATATASADEVVAKKSSSSEDTATSEGV
ncbi:MAG: MotA/TolQ/ExbB proton channel family protein [Planctomycetes bacterium]|nr:MotA/TolQ/ExbB proton channel family protein [Planctomycetota bacterium]